MFWRKTCKKCGRKIEKNFSFCPFCGYNLNRESEARDFGFLGKNDGFDFFNEKEEFKLPLGFNFLFRNLMKEMDKQFKALDRELGKEVKEKRIRERTERIKFPFSQKGGISINISSGVGKPIIRVKSFGNAPEFKDLEEEIKGKQRKTGIETEKAGQITKQIDEEKAKQLAKLPRQEAESKVRRLSGKVIYEIELPGVENKDDVIVNELENSIEIKAFAKDKAYFKFLPVALPLLRYALKKGKLILELGEE